jgi:hypothetical protein
MAWAAYWADEAKEERIRSIVKDLAERYGIPFNDNTIWSFAGMVYREFFLNDEDKTRSRTYEEANKIINFLDIKTDAKGETSIKHQTGSFKMDADFLKKLKYLLLGEYTEIISDPALSGSEDERKEQIRHLADQERRDKVHALKQSLNRLVAWLKGVGIFTDGLKTVANSEGAFLYDLLYRIEKDLHCSIFTKTKTDKVHPKKLDNATKRKIMGSYIVDRKGHSR